MGLGGLGYAVRHARRLAVQVEMATQAGSTEDEDFPGGDHLAAARRELREELARDDLEVGPWIGRPCHTFWLGRWMTQRERWLLCRAEPFDVDPARVASLEVEAVQELRVVFTAVTRNVRTSVRSDRVGISAQRSA